MYRPAAFGNILSYWIVKTHRLTGKSSAEGYGYTFYEKGGCNLKLAWK